MVRASPVVGATGHKVSLGRRAPDAVSPFPSLPSLVTAPVAVSNLHSLFNDFTMFTVFLIITVLLSVEVCVKLLTVFVVTSLFIVC